MKVSVNGQEVEVFSGATVSDVLRRFSKKEFKLVEIHEKKVCDHRGNELELDGELRGGEELFVESVQKPECCT